MKLVLIKLVVSAFTAWVVSHPLIKAATIERGYTGAYGGEWLAIIGTFMLTYYLTSKGSNAIVINNKKSKEDEPCTH